MPRDYPRSRRIEDQIQRLLSEILRTKVRDPRLSAVIITAVKVSKDLGVAIVYYSILQSEGEAEPLDDAFKSAMGFLRRSIASELTIRRAPELRFVLDTLGASARSMDQLIAEANRQDNDGSNEPS